jgi:simple sugar transport system permease protein
VSGADRPARWRRVLQRLVDASATERILISFAALVLAIAVGAVIVVVSGVVATCREPSAFLGLGSCYDPVQVYHELFLGSLGHPFASGWDPFNFRMAVTLQETTLLIFTGLSVAVAFRAGLFNIGTQGQLVLGGLGTALAVIAAGPYVPGGVVGTLVLIPLGLLAGAVVGGAWGALPGALKAYANANEVITTIMLNTVAANVAFFLVASYFVPPEAANTQTADVPAEAVVPNLPFGIAFQPRDSFSLFALAIGVAFVAVVFYLFTRTAFGYDLRTSGLQPDAAEYSGVDAKRMVVSSMTLSGALGGVGGAMYVLMVEGKWLTQIPALGFDGITVSILAGNNPLGVGFAALLFGVLKSGALAVDFATDVPRQLVGVLRGLIILFVAMPEFFRMVGAKFVDTGRSGGAVPADDADTGSGSDSGSGSSSDPSDPDPDPDPDPATDDAPGSTATPTGGDPDG